MVWEQQCPLVVMLTTLVEQGRVKCHQYWPDAGETQLFGDFEVTTETEEVTESFAFREIKLVYQEVSLGVSCWDCTLCARPRSVKFCYY